MLATGKGDPYFVCHDSPLSDKSLMDGHEVLNFGSYNYEGMSGRREVCEAAKQTIDRYGTGASRLLAGEKTLHRELEREITHWKHAEDALVRVGGHFTNVTYVGNFCGKGDLIVYDVLAHNSIEQGCRLSQAEARSSPHSDADALEGILRMRCSRYGKVFIVIDGAYSMEYARLCAPEEAVRLLFDGGRGAQRTMLKYRFFIPVLVAQRLCCRNACKCIAAHRRRQLIFLDFYYLE